jgi:hypothetical protein
MLDTIPIRTPSAARLIECPPRREAKPADPCAVVIFGATGDRQVVPALYNLSRSKVLPEQFALIGVARSDGTAEGWRERLYDMLKSFVGHAGAEFNTDRIDEDAWARLGDKMAYIGIRASRTHPLLRASRAACAFFVAWDTRPILAGDTLVRGRPLGDGRMPSLATSPAGGGDGN